MSCSSSVQNECQRVDDACPMRERVRPPSSPHGEWIHDPCRVSVELTLSRSVVVDSLTVRRSVSLVLALILAVSSAVVSPPHVHAYDGHDHPEHQHGPASHEHDAHHPDVDDDAGFHFEACAPGDHVLEVPAAAVPLPQSHVQLAVLTMTVAAAPATSGRLAAAPIDVRVHGPPPDTRLPARGPPLTCLA